MPSVMTLEGPKLGCGPCTKAIGSAPTQEQCMAQVRKEGLIVAGIVAVIGGAMLWFGTRSRRGALRGPEMLKIIASESRTAEEFARRVEAWNSAEREPLSVAKLAKAYRKAKPSTVARLIRDARDARTEGRERLWSRMSKGLRGLAGYRVYYVLNVGGRVVRAPDDHEFEMKATAINRLKQYKRRGMTAWVEDENGFVPVPGAMRPNNLSKR